PEGCLSLCQHQGISFPRFSHFAFFQQIQQPNTWERSIKFITDGMGDRIRRECMRALLQRGRANPTATILGITFKENVPDIRNSKVIDIARELERVGVIVQVTDPLASAEETILEYGIKLRPLESLRPADAVIFAVAHKEYVAGNW